ncbi:family 43 glycosylhydrolase, partial [Streptomyces sp. NPDC058855]|uniref:family 43 glycosylhydrolase n=1 Tax=Streptomyces sp. NPDC058855 TaxID=3346651 RepID=UPI0036C05909
MTSTQIRIKSRRPWTPSQIVLTLIGVAVSAVFVTPIAAALFTSFKSEAEAAEIPPHWLPEVWTTQAWTALWETGNVTNWFVNSLVVSVCVTSVVLTVSALAGYGFARTEFRGKSVLMGIVMSGLMISPAVLGVPLFTTVQQMGMVDTYWGMILPQCAPAAMVYILYKFFQGIPRELEEAAFIDGAGRYWLYYAVSSWGTNHSAIGVATSLTGLPGTWTDHGKVFSSETTDSWNAIDPAIIRADGRLWMSFGSYWTGIRMIELNPFTGKALPNPTVHHLATRPDVPYAVEGPEIVKHGRYYYLFASYDACCAGANSTYKIKVGRSTSVTGPYADSTGKPMLEGGGDLLLEGHGRYIGTGGQSVFQD